MYNEITKYSYPCKKSQSLWKNDTLYWPNVYVTLDGNFQSLECFLITSSQKRGSQVALWQVTCPFSHKQNSQAEVFQTSPWKRIGTSESQDAM